MPSTSISTTPGTTTPSSTISFTLRNPPHTYLHLLTTTPTKTNTSSSNNQSQLQPLDEITLRTHLTSALAQYLGITGTAIPIDIFKVENAGSGGGEAWVRVPRSDEKAVVAALSQWVGKGGVVVRILRRGSWLGGLVGGGDDGGDGM